MVRGGRLGRAGGEDIGGYSLVVVVRMREGGWNGGILEVYTWLSSWDRLRGWDGKDKPIERWIDKR